MVLFRPVALLLALVVSDLHCLPWSISISERQGPSTALQSFSLNCSSHMPTLKLLHVRPPTTFFNTLSLSITMWQGVYMGKLTLNNLTWLDTLAGSHYELQLQVTCGTLVMEGPLSVDVQWDPDRIQCAARFASPVIQVLETITPGARLYTLLLPDLGLQGAQINITSAQDPPHFPGPFSINGQGWLQAPPQGLKGQAPKTFQLQILVTLGASRSCRGVLTVKVLSVPSSRVSFLEQNRNITIPEDLAPGSKVVQVQARGLDVRYEILSPVPCPLFSIGPADGVIRTTGPLHLAPGAAVTVLQVKAFERLLPWASVQLDLTLNVTPVNRWPPRCHPALLVTQVPETVPVGTVLRTFTCADPDSPASTLDYKLRLHGPPGLSSLCLSDRDLKVNATLDCDVPGACLQLTASILVFDGGQPLMTTEVPVLVMVTPVNEFSPACAPRVFRVREDAGPRTLLGSVVGTDMDYPRDNVEYSSSGGSAAFSVDRRSGEVRLLGPLDYEQQRLHRLAVLVTDQSRDPDSVQHRTGSCTVTIEVEDVNDHAPECEPPFQELTIHTSPGRSLEVTKVSCRVPQEPQRLAFSYSIVGGNSQSRFILQGAILVHSDVMLGPPWPEQPHTYELLIRVADAGPSIPHLSTTATIIVHLVPWRASTEATSTHRATVPSTRMPLLVTDTEAFWQPEPWFVVALTVTSVLLLLALGWLLGRLRRGLAQGLQTPSKPAQALLLNSIQGTEGSTEALRTETRRAPSSSRGLHFDGRAQDSRESPSSQTTSHPDPLSLLSPSQGLLPPSTHYLMYSFPEWGGFSLPLTFQTVLVKHLWGQEMTQSHSGSCPREQGERW
ncbi:cadherin-related family member 4 isoform X3 [Sturnira hondurensis]|uniref:cadherin-related family member 4 isoform X3 n=1 Tax=Sturnira hondurensis TaxID=192404 RepID=UPI00187AEF1F|nr:cadherin-related family member 4 isoform X3 [Sturnira hondurensis]